MEKPDDLYGEFLLKEYDNIAEAHFRTIETISEFFKHYIYLITVPMTLITVVFNLDFIQQGITQPANLTIGLYTVFILFLIISFVGLLVLWHILNLRWDALLYARTVNGIRKYFYDRTSNVEIKEKLKIRVLPQSPVIPSYREFHYFGPVVLSFALLNSVYFFFAIAIGGIIFNFNDPSTKSIVFTGIFVGFHLFLYLILAQKRELSYLHSNVIGIDIDGVLNLHRDQFSKFVVDKLHKQLIPSDITRIPVHECPDQEVTKSDEFTIFNNPDYWTTMPVNFEAAEILQRLKNSMKLEIHIFTNRPWPIKFHETSEQFSSVISSYEVASKKYKDSVWKKITSNQKLKYLLSELNQISPYKWRRVKSLFRRDRPIDLITKVWLLDNGITYDKIMIESGSEDVYDPAAHVHNRFYASRTIPIKYFVEDDPIKADKLAYICDVVFLINHPYNLTYTMPSNVIRVDNWNDILLNMRKLW